VRPHLGRQGEPFGRLARRVIERGGDAGSERVAVAVQLLHPPVDGGADAGEGLFGGGDEVFRVDNPRRLAVPHPHIVAVFGAAAPFGGVLATTRRIGHCLQVALSFIHPAEQVVPAPQRFARGGQNGRAQGAFGVERLSDAQQAVGVQADRHIRPDRGAVIKDTGHGWFPSQ